MSTVPARDRADAAGASDVATSEPIAAADPLARAVRRLRPIGLSLLARLEQPGPARAALAGLMAVSVGLSLWLTRGTMFHADEILYYVENRGLNLRVLIAPRNGHLIFIPRLIYAAVFAVAGAGHYVILRAIEAVGVVLVSGLVFTFARRRVGLPIAFVPAVVLLFLGSSWQDTLDPAGITHVYCLAFGLGALLVLERSHRRADVLACLLLSAAVATFSAGLAFVVGAAVAVGFRPRWRARAWIVLVPIALYVAWMVAPKLHTPPFSTDTGVQATNLLLIPNYAADAAAAIAGGVAGLGYNFSFPASYTVDTPWGYLLAAAAAFVLLRRLRGGRVQPSLWVALAMLATLWVMTGLVTTYSREPTQNRYVYDGTVLALLVGCEALVGVRLSRRAAYALLCALVFAVPANIALLRAGAGALRGTVPSDRAELTAIEIARDRVSPGFVPQGDAQLTLLIGIARGAGSYLAAVRRNGSLAFTLPQLRAQTESVREVADRTLAAALGIGLAPAPPATPGRCLTVRARATGIDMTVRPPGLVIRAPTSEPLTLRRFAALATVQAGQLPAGSAMALALPRDRAPDPWHVVVRYGPLAVCPLGG